MLIIMLTKVKNNGVVHAAGTEVLVTNDEAFKLIRGGHAQPATRRARKEYSAMLEAHEARNPPENGPDIRDQYVSAPKIQNTLQARTGRINLSNRAI